MSKHGIRFLIDGVEQRLWELIKTNRRKARQASGGSIKKGFLQTQSQSSQDNEGNPEESEVKVEEIVNDHIGDPTAPDSSQLPPPTEASASKDGDGNQEEEVDEGSGLGKPVSDGKN